MDVDKSGYIEAPELMLLGIARRTLGQKVGKWTKEMNQRMVANLDTNGDGKIGPKEFAKYFERILPENATEFAKTMREFLAVAADIKAEPSLKPSPSPRSNRTQPSPRSAPAASQPSEQQRLAELKEVHTAMDVDSSGYIEAPELMLLGIARRTLGQKEGEWTKEMNQRMVDRMDINLDGKIGPKEFAKYFERVLPIDAADFAKTMKQFLAVAAEVQNGPKPTPPIPDLDTTRSRAGSGAKFEIRGSKPLPLAAQKKDVKM